MAEGLSHEQALIEIPADINALERRNAELQASNRQVTESLEQQTAMGEVLRVIAPFFVWRALVVASPLFRTIGLAIESFAEEAR